jgi:hypothetical protein
MDLDKLDYRQAVAGIEERAPHWFSLLRLVLGNKRKVRSSYPTHEKWDTVHKRMFSLTAQVCFARSRERASAFPASVGVYLLGSGCNRRVVETLAGFGFCHSYHHLNGLFDRVSAHAAVRTPARPSKRQRVT